VCSGSQGENDYAIIRKGLHVDLEFRTLMKIAMFDPNTYSIFEFQIS